MNRALFLLTFSALALPAADDSKQPPADAHAPLFRSKVPQAGKVTPPQKSAQAMAGTKTAFRAAAPIPQGTGPIYPGRRKTF